MASASKPESLAWTVNEVELLLRLTLNYKESELQEGLNISCSTNTHVVRDCCCSCYETSQGSELKGKRSRGGAMTSSFWKVCRFTVQIKTWTHSDLVLEDVDSLRPDFRGCGLTQTWF